MMREFDNWKFSIQEDEIPSHVIPSHSGFLPSSLEHQRSECMTHIYWNFRWLWITRLSKRHAPATPPRSLADCDAECVKKKNPQPRWAKLKRFWLELISCEFALLSAVFGVIIILIRFVVCVGPTLDVDWCSLQFEENRVSSPEWLTRYIYHLVTDMALCWNLRVEQFRPSWESKAYNFIAVEQIDCRISSLIKSRRFERSGKGWPKIRSRPVHLSGQMHTD